jgi:hypothetical protein
MAELDVDDGMWVGAVGLFSVYFHRIMNGASCSAIASARSGGLGLRRCNVSMTPPTRPHCDLKRSASNLLVASSPCNADRARL